MSKADHFQSGRDSHMTHSSEFEEVNIDTRVDTQVDMLLSNVTYQGSNSKFYASVTV